MALQSILESFQNDPTIKWKILNRVRKTRVIDTSKLVLKDKILFNGNTPLDTPWGLISHFLPTVHHNQTVNLSSSLFETLTHIDFFKKVKRNSQIQIVQGIVSILNSLYAIYNSPTDAITWTLALGAIVTTVLMITSMCSASKGFRAAREAFRQFELHPDQVQDLVSQIVSSFTPDQTEEPEPERCHHGAERVVSPQEFREMLGKFVVHRITDAGETSTIEGVGKFMGCACIYGPTDDVVLFLTDKNQNASPDIPTRNPIGHSLTAILSLIYVLGVAGLTKCGFSNIRELLDLARLKNEMKTSVNDMKNFIQFIAGDLCSIDIMGDRKLLESLNQQIMTNTQLLELKPVAFVRQHKKFYELTQAMIDTTNKLKMLTSNQELRASQNALVNLLNSTFLSLTELKTHVIQLKMTLNTRPDVHVTFLYGKAGVGKTSLAKYIHQEVSRRLGIDPAVYNLNFPENMHWPAYAGQENCTYDEFGARKDKDPFLVSLNGFCSTGYFSMDGADLAYKPQPCAVRHLILIGNAARWPLKNTLITESVDAMWSRMKTYHVSFPGYDAAKDRYSKANRRPDFSHLVFNEQTFSNQDNDHKPRASVTVSLEDIIQRAVIAYREHTQTFEEAPAIVNLERREEDRNQAENTTHLVLNLSGVTGVGKTTTFIQHICPALSKYMRISTVHITSVTQMTESPGTRAIYVLDDILTNSASEDTIRLYCEFYARVQTGSLIILISNMTMAHKPGIQWSKYGIPIPVPYWKKQLPTNYHNNDACIRRLGLTGWVNTRTQPYHTGFTDTELVFTKMRKVVVGDREPMGVSDTIEFIFNRYCQHLREQHDFTIMEVDRIFEPDDSYVKITGFTVEQLHKAVQNGGISLMIHLGKNICIPEKIFRSFSYSYPLENFAFDLNANLHEIGPALARIFRRNCPDGELYIDCGDVQLITEGNLIKTTIHDASRISTEIKQLNHLGQQMIVVNTFNDKEGRQVLIPLQEVFAWMQGDVLIIQQYRLFPVEISVLERWCKLHPCAFQKLLREKTWRECEVELTSLHNKLIPAATTFITSLPIVEVLACLVGIAFGAWVISRIVKSYFKTIDTNQVMPMGSLQSPDEPAEPDVNDYLRKQYRKQQVELNKDTAHKFNLTAYDADYAAWQRASKNQMLLAPIVNNPSPEDVVVQAVVAATVKCSSYYGMLHGVMIYDKVGITNAHLFGNEKARNPSLSLDTFTFQVQHLAMTYTAQIMRYQPAHDFMLFQILDKTCPAFQDIRKYFFSYSDYRDAETYTAAMIKHRRQPVLEKCQVTFDRTSAPYWNNSTETGVKSNGLSIAFITSNNAYATADGDCGSMYLTTGPTYGRHQHARILGMHVGMRSSLYPHGTIIPREVLEGKVSDLNQSLVSPSYVNPIPTNPYGLEGDQLYDEFIVELVTNLEPAKNAFSGQNIQVLGIDPTQYVEPLKPARVATGFVDLVEKRMKTTSGKFPTSTVGRKMDLSQCLKNQLGKPDILLTQFAPYDHLLPRPDKQHLDWCIENIMDRFAALYEPLTHPLSTKVLFNGFPPGHPRHGTVNPINLQSSAGIYFLKKHGIQRKAEFFVRDEEGYLLLAPTKAAMEYFSRAKAFVRALTEGKIPQTLTKTCLKSELRPFEKVKVGKIRTFDSADASLVLAHREILMGAMSSVQMATARHKAPLQIGINALLDFPVIFNRFDRIKNCQLLQFDFTEFDRHLSFELIEGAYRIALHIQDPRPESREKNKTLARALALQTTCTLRMVGNQVLMTFQGISSGFYFTSLGDSIANYIMLMYVIMKQRQKDASWFFQHIDAVILGDDISVCLSPQAVAEVNLSQLVATYGELGAKVTAADKVSDIQFQPLMEFAFCSRTIRFTRNNIIVPPLKRSTILAFIEWVTPSKGHEFIENGQTIVHSTEEQIVSNLNFCLTEAACHSKNFFDDIRIIAQNIQRIMIAKQVPMRIVNKLECTEHHKVREVAIENIILGRGNLKVFDHNQLLIKEKPTMSITLTEEWCASFKRPKPIIKKHTVPENGESSQCLVETSWDEPMMFLGQGANKKASKADAFDQIVNHFKITKIDSAALSSFCNSKIKEDNLLKSIHHDGDNFIVVIHPNQGEVTEDYWLVQGKAPLLSEANFTAIVKLKEHYNLVPTSTISRLTVYCEPGTQQMDRDTSHPAVPTRAVSDAGLSMTSQPAQPTPPPADITPHVMQPPMEQIPLVTMQGGPVAVAQTPNILKPADMLAFGGVDFTIRDAAHNQVIDHNPSIAISQAATRGQIVALDSYNPYDKNPKIQAWVSLHQRYVGGINLRYHLIANPIFMGELAVAWLPDVRHLRVGDTIPDSVFQLYSWKTISLREGATEYMTLEDARENQFYRTSDVVKEDLTLSRPGIVVIIYQPMVNPFDNQQAACYLNIGSVLAADFRVSNPVNTFNNIPPTGDQNAALNSLSGNTFGTIFSEIGVLDAQEVFMSTDGNFFPTQAALTTTQSTRSNAFPPYNFPQILQYADYTNPSSTGPNLIVGHQLYASAADMQGVVNAPTFFARGFGDVQTFLLQGSYPTADLPSKRLIQNLSGTNWNDIVAAFSNPTTTGADAVYEDVVAAGRYSFNVGNSWGSFSPTKKLTVAWGENILQIFASAGSHGASTSAYIRLIVPVVTTIRTRVAYNYPLLSLPPQQRTLRFSLRSFPAISYVASPQASVPNDDFEQRMYRYFNTITSTTGGFVQFGLIDPVTAMTVATVRFDHAVGFTILEATPASGFTQWNGTHVNNLVFQNVQFGNRTSTFPVTNVSTWIDRLSSAFNPPSPRPVDPPLLASFIKAKTIPAQTEPVVKMEDHFNQMVIDRQLRSSVYVEGGHQQAAIAGMVGAGILSGIGSSVGSYLTAQQQRDFERSMQERKYNFESVNYEKYRNIDMRTKQELAGALAPINQLNSTRDQTSGLFDGSGKPGTNSTRWGAPIQSSNRSSGFRSISNPPGARPFVPSAASQRPF